MQHNDFLKTPVEFIANDDETTRDTCFVHTIFFFSIYGPRAHHTFHYHEFMEIPHESDSIEQTSNYYS